MARSEEDVIAGVLHLTAGGQARELPTLKIKDSRKWKAKVAETLGGFTLPDSSLASTAWLSSLATIPGELMLDLVLAYDTSYALSDTKTAAANRKWVEENLDDRELYAALKEMVQASYPLVVDARSFVQMFGPQLMAAAGPQLRGVLSAFTDALSSTNGASPNGVSTPTPLSLASPTSS